MRPLAESNDMGLIGKTTRILREIFTDPMPLHEFVDYDDYWEQRGGQEPKFRFDWVARRLPEQGTVLDVGCGDGAFLEHVRGMRPRLRLCGTDGSAAAIGKLRERGLDGELVADLNAPEIELPREVDVIVAMELIEHLPEPEHLMGTFLRTRAQIFYITIPNLGFIVHRLRLALGGRMPVTAVVYHIKEHLRFWTVRDFRQWARHCGFEVVEHVGQNGFPGLWKIWPSLFARQMIYVLRRR